MNPELTQTYNLSDLLHAAGTFATDDEIEWLGANILTMFENLKGAGGLSFSLSFVGSIDYTFECTPAQFDLLLNSLEGVDIPQEAEKFKERSKLKKLQEHYKERSKLENQYEAVLAHNVQLKTEQERLEDLVQYWKDKATNLGELCTRYNRSLENIERIAKIQRGILRVKGDL